MPICAHCQGELDESADVCGGCGRLVVEPPADSGIQSPPESEGSDFLADPTAVATHASALHRRSMAAGNCPACGEDLFASDDICGGCGRSVDLPATDSGVHTHVTPPSGVGATIVARNDRKDYDDLPAVESGVITQTDPPTGAGATIVARNEDGDSDVSPSSESDVHSDSEPASGAPPTVVVRREDEEDKAPVEDSGILSNAGPPGAAATVIARGEAAATCPVCKGDLTPNDRACGQCGRAVSSSFDDATVVSTDANALQTIAGAPSLQAKAWLVVTRGCHPRVEYPLRPGLNLIGRGLEDIQIDLADQESPDVALASRRHAVIRVEGDAVTVEDLASLNGTFVNRTKIKPGVATPLGFGDVVQIGTVLMELES